MADPRGHGLQGKEQRPQGEGLGDLSDRWTLHLQPESWKEVVLARGTANPKALKQGIPASCTGGWGQLFQGWVGGHQVSRKDAVSAAWQGTEITHRKQAGPWRASPSGRGEKDFSLDSENGLRLNCVCAEMNYREQKGPCGWVGEGQAGGGALVRDCGGGKLGDGASASPLERPRVGPSTISATVPLPTSPSQVFISALPPEPLP